MSEPDPQILTLTVVSSHATQLGARSCKMFAGKGGTIGRSEENDWVLSAAGVSRTHAIIQYVNGLYFIEDRSTNGMLLNDSPLTRGNPAALKEGDHLRIDNFDIAVGLREDSETIVQVVPREPEPFVDVPDTTPPPQPPAEAASIPAAMPADDLLDFGLGAAPSTAAPTPGTGGDSLIPDAPAEGAGLDPLRLFDDPPAPATPGPLPEEPAQSWNHSSGTQDYFRPPQTDVQREANALPEDWDLDLGPTPAPAAPEPPPIAPPSQVPPTPVPAAPPAAAPPAPEPVPPQPPAPAAPPTSAAAPPAQVVPASAAAPEVDAVLRIVVDGVMDVLRARAEIKNTFRLPMTIIQRTENNPLKFALGTDEALRKILAAPDPAFLTGAAAFEDAFDDIRCHQMAMLAGVRAGFDALLKHFDPARFEDETGSGGHRGFGGGKGRRWEHYRAHYQSLTADPDDCFRRLFGDEFARAYEEQLARLKAARRSQRGQY